MPRARARGRANLYCDDDAFARAAACLCIAETDRVVRTRTEDFPQVQRRSGDPRRAKVELQTRQQDATSVPALIPTMQLKPGWPSMAFQTSYRFGPSGTESPV